MESRSKKTGQPARVVKFQGISSGVGCGQRGLGLSMAIQSAWVCIFEYCVEVPCVVLYKTGPASRMHLLFIPKSGLFYWRLTSRTSSAGWRYLTAGATQGPKKPCAASHLCNMRHALHVTLKMQHVACWMKRLPTLLDEK